MSPRPVLASLSVLLVAFVAVVAFVAPGAQVHYVPSGSTGFSYDETISLGSGTGNYSGYTESTAVNGSIAVTSVLENGSDQARYYNEDHYSNNSGGSYSWTSSGPFVFSPDTFRYQGSTDNQTGYSNPSVWFFIDNSVGVGSSVTLLNTGMTVVSTSYNYNLNTAAGGTVRTIFVEGNGSYTRDDSYGVFQAVYNWKAYFDPGTGFIVGYLYTEQDSSGPNGFSLTDSLAVTSTTYPLTSGSSSSGSSSSNGSSIDEPLLIGAIVVVVIIVIVIVVVLAASRARRRHPMPRHSATGQMTYRPPPMGPAPPPIQLTPSGQPMVQQIIVKETVKVKCQYCGSLIDSTAEKCPFCGATRN